jgi:DNA invertase Pin-like site-specific DNA recombinase
MKTSARQPTTDAAPKWISYVRVSTDRQGRSGLGLAAQETAIARHVADGTVIASYREIESGRNNERPELKRALDHARRSGATIIFGKVDRLARSTSFLLSIVESGVDVFFCDLPEVSGPAGRFLLTSMAAVAQLEAELISERTKAALAAAKARGQKLGARPGASPLSAYLHAYGNVAGVEGSQRAADARAEAYRETVAEMIAARMGNTAIAAALNAAGERSVSGGLWTPTGVRRLLARLGMARAMSEAADAA